MGSSENVLIRPGALLIFLIAAIIGMAIFNWSGNMLDRTGEISENQRQEALECSTLEVNFVDSNRDSGNFTVFFQVNKDVEAVAVTLQGEEKNATRVIEDPGKGAIYPATAELDRLKSVKAVVEGCKRVFTR